MSEATSFTEVRVVSSGGNIGRTNTQRATAAERPETEAS